ncbi:MAG TPA: hypothetical protein VI685_00655 [Candidatus Angelobacter sp.]
MGETWYGFAAYPGTRELCTQFVLGTRREELHWRSFATTDAPDRVAAFYRKKEPGSEIKGGASITLRHGEDTTLEVYPASAGGYPTCDQKPGPQDKSVIVATNLVSRGR